MKSLLIRAEDKNKWERRSTLVPADLMKLQEQVPFNLLIENSAKRYFKEVEFVEIGAQQCQGMEKGDIVFGVKEIPEEKIIDGKVYLFFSHTIKGQQENMPMLRRLMDSGSTLIDYEKITDDHGRRKVFFGPFAGDAGAIDIMWLLGENWRAKGIKSIFSDVKQALHYDSVDDAKQKITELGKLLKGIPFPESIEPVVIGILGYGNVSQGARRIFECLPYEYIEPQDLKSFIESGRAGRDKIYLTVFKEEDLVESKSGQAFELQDYYDHPHKYQAKFSPYLDYLTILVNATYWEARYPKFVTWDSLKNLFGQNKSAKLAAIADITCDINGSIECNVKSTDSGDPAYRVLPLQHTTEDGHIGEGIILLAVDNLPAELPKDASEYFSAALTPFVPGILSADFSKPLAESGLPPEIINAVIVYNGELTKNYLYLNDFLG